MLKKLIIVAASLLVAKTVVEVAAEENEKVSSVVETVKTYIRKVVNKMTVEVEEVREFVKSIMNDHPNASEGIKLSAIGSLIGGGITAVTYFGFKMVTEYLPKAFSRV